MLHGELEIGTEKALHTRKATITFTDNVKGEDISGTGGANNKVDRGIMLMGGTLNLHGDRKNTWSRLANTANTGSTSIQVLDASGWRAGDEIVLGPPTRRVEWLKDAHAEPGLVRARPDREVRG